MRSALSVVFWLLFVGCEDRPSPSPGPGPDAAQAARPEAAKEAPPPPVDWYLDALRACPAQREGCAGARDGALFEATALLVGRDRSLATPERLATLSEELRASLDSDAPAEVQVALAGLAALGAGLPPSRPALVRLGVPAQIVRILQEEPGPRERGRGLMALGALLADGTEGQAQAVALIRAGLDDADLLVRRQAVVAATLLGDDALRGDLLRRLLLDLGGRPGPTPRSPPTPETLPPPPTTLPPERAAAFLPLLPAYMHLLLSLPGPKPAAYALSLAQMAARAQPRAAVAHFFVARAADKAGDKEALPALRRALSLGNLPGNFLTELGAAGQSLIEPPDTEKGRARVRALLAARPAWMAKAQEAAPHRVVRPGQARPRQVDPADLERRISALLRRLGPGDRLDGEEAQRLGAEVFLAYPFGSDTYYDACLRSFLSIEGDNRDLLPRLGLVAEGAGGERIVGVVAARIEGKERLGVTCALCHTQVDEAGRRWDGLPTRSYDQGLLLASCVEHPIHHKSGNRNQEELLAYGPGRNDSTSDGVDNPTDIPSMYGLRTGRAVRWSGDTPTLEVQIDRNLSPHSAPPGVVRVLAAYLRRLPLPPPPDDPAPPALLARGAEIFAAACARCHRGEALTTGEVVPLSEVGTDGTRLLSVLPNSTPGYKVPSLLRIARSAPYLHDGSVPTLEALLSPRRKGGHRFGLDRLAAPIDRAALLAYLRTR